MTSSSDAQSATRSDEYQWLRSLPQGELLVTIASSWLLRFAVFGTLLILLGAVLKRGALAGIFGIIGTSFTVFCVSFFFAFRWYREYVNYD